MNSGEIITFDQILSASNRFWSHVDIRGLDECWFWIGGVKDSYQGYGSFRFLGFSTRAHQFSLALKLGRWPKLSALHTCDNNMCCNEDHLYEGTQADNMNDSVVRNRHRGNRNQFGTNNKQSKLTIDQVKEIRKLRKLKRVNSYYTKVSMYSYSQLGKMFGITAASAYNVVKKISYAEV